MGEHMSSSSVRTAYHRSPFSSASTSPNATFRPVMFSPVSSGANHMHIYSTSPIVERRPVDRSAAMPVLSLSASDPANSGQETRKATAIIIRRLPRTIGSEALRSLLTFAADLLDVDLIRSPYGEDHGFATAVARFKSPAGALEAQQKLNGKPNATKEANMIVEAHSRNMIGLFERRNTVDGAASRFQSDCAASNGSTGTSSGRSRFGSAYQSSDQTSPPLLTPSSGGSNDFPVPDTSPHFQTLFSAHSPQASGLDDIYRMSGKSMINDDLADDETRELLRDPVAYAQGGQQYHLRRPIDSQMPIARFGSLSLSTSNGGSNGMGSSPSTGVASPMNGSALQTPNTSTSPTSTNGVGSSHHGSTYPRHQYPPVNPADQNPPCNTLYVGNLPVDTSEDELKAIFSKQRGYKRLCFRTKQNGPMCFVEFEDVSFATKALNELYGYTLHNSLKTGMRLSFSKNPLGVRSVPPHALALGLGLGPHPAMNPQAMAPGYGGGLLLGGTSFSSVSGPPPGLVAPSSVLNGGGTNGVGGGVGGYRSASTSAHIGGAGMDSMFANPFGLPPQDFAGQLGGPRTLSGGVPPNMGNGNYGREHRGGYANLALFTDGQGYSDYNMGR